MKVLYTWHESLSLSPGGNKRRDLKILLAVSHGWTRFLLMAEQQPNVPQYSGCLSLTQLGLGIV